MKWPRRLIAPAAVALVLPVLVPCWVVVLPRLWFDVDPRTPGADVISTLGPGGFAWLAAFGVAAALFALLIHVMAGGAVRWFSTVLVLVGVAWTAWHAPARFENLWHGVGWVWGASAGLAALHLGAWPAARRWAAALLAGFSAALLADAVFYVFVEHPMMVREFEKHADALLQARGWEAGSSEATLYERRIRTTDAIGALGLSNVLGTIAAALAMLGLGAAAWGGLRAWAARKRSASTAVADDASCKGRALGWAWALAVLLCGLVVVKLTNSAGALGAAVLVTGWLAFAVLLTRACPGVMDFSPCGVEDANRSTRTEVSGKRARPVRWRGWCLGLSAAALPLLVIAGVALRGWIGVPAPEEVGQGVKGELSVLFRWQYWGAAWRMVTESAGHANVGVGPGAFGDLYLIHKDRFNPEEVTSAHNVFVDWVTMLGVGGWAWSVLVLVWLFGGARGLVLGKTEPGDGLDANTASNRSAGYVMFGLAIALFGFEVAVAWDELLGVGLGVWVMRLGAAAGFVAVAIGVWTHVGDTALRWGLVVAAAAALTHSQFDMGFFQPTSSPVLWVIVGLAGAVVTPGGNASGRVSRWAERAAVGFVVVFMLLVMGRFVGPMSEYASRTAEAAADVRAGDLEAAQAKLIEAHGAVGFDPVLVRWHAALTDERANRALANGEASLASGIWRDGIVDLWTLTQWRPGAARTFADTRANLEQSVANGDPLAVWTMRSQLELLEASTADAQRERGWAWRNPGVHRTLTRLYQRWLDAEVDPMVQRMGRDFGLGTVWAGQRAAIERSPMNVSDHVRLAELLDELTALRSAEAEVDVERVAELRGRAGAAAEEALQLDAERYLDPGKQLDEATRERMRDVVARGGGEPAAP